MPKTESETRNQPSVPPRPVWVVSELYYPEETSTGYILTKIAEGLAENHPVRVLCGQPTYSLRGVRAPRREQRQGVSIQRCRGTTFDKDKLPLRLFNLFTLSVSLFVAMLLRLRRNDRVLVVTNPPLLPFVTVLACKLRGAKCQLLIHDVYPDVMVAAGMLRRTSWPYRILDRIVRMLYQSVEKIIVLGRDMEELVRQKLPTNHDPKRVSIIPNWADLELVQPQPRHTNRMLVANDLLNKFVVQYAGNMGRSHNIESIAKCIERLPDGNVHFLMVGWGAKQDWLEKFCREKGLTNVTFAGRLPRSEQPVFLNACDVSLITFVSGMSGISVPSRMYNVLASGKPILAMTDAESELARVVREEQVGWVVAPDDVEKLVDVIRDAATNEEECRQMGRRARHSAESKYNLQRIVEAFERSLFPNPSDSLPASHRHRQAA